MEELVLRKSVWSLILVACLLSTLILFGIALAILQDSIFAPIFLIGFSVLLLVFCAWTTCLKLTLTSSGISQQCLLSGWRFAWSEINGWSEITDFEGDEYIYFRTKSKGKIYRVNMDVIDYENTDEVKGWFTKYCGQPLSGDEAIEPKWSKGPTWLQRRFW